MKKHVITLWVGLIFCFPSFSLAVTPSFQWLGGFADNAQAVSSDGLVVVGYGNSGAGDEAFRWTSDGGVFGLGDLPGGVISSYATGVSVDGSVIVGHSTSGSGQEAFRWENNTMTGLGDLPGGNFYSVATGVSGDGTVVVGFSNTGIETDPSTSEAFRWTEDSGMVGLGALPGGDFGSWAFAVSNDDSVIVGQSETTLGYREAVRWQDGVIMGLGDLPGGDFHSVAYGVSADGSVVVGDGISTFGTEAFRWEDGTMIGLGDLPGTNFRSHAYDVSADGSIIVGVSSGEVGNDAFIWDAVNGMRSLQDVLENEYGLDLNGWTLNTAMGISDDGHTIVGYGTGGAYIVTIPEPSTLLLLGLGGLLIRKRK